MRRLKKALIAYVNSMKAIWSAIAHPLSIVSKRKGTLKGYRIYGNSVQEGENLHDATKDTNGVYIDDVGTELTGSARLSDYIEVVGGANYTVKSVNAQVVRVNYYDSEKVWISQAKYTGTNGSTLSKTMTISDGVAYVRISYPSSLALLFYREVSPENPIEVQSVGELTKNLFNPDSPKQQGFLMQDGTIHFNGNYPHIYCFTLAVKPNTLYIFNVHIKDNVVYALYNEAMEFIRGYRNTEGLKDLTFTTTSDSAYVKICSNINRVNEGVQYFNEGDTLIKEPYHKYKVPVTVGGKNLFNYEDSSNHIVGSLMSDGTNNGDANWRITDYIPVSGTSFVLSGIQSGLSSSACAYDSDKNYLMGVKYNGSNRNVKLTSETQIAFIRFSYSVSSSIPWDLSKVQLYIEPQIHNIYLDEPLRKIVNHKDYIDFNKSVVVRNIGEVVVTSDMVKEKNNWYYQRNWNAYRVTLSDFKTYFSNYQSGDYSNYFKSTIGGYTSVSLGSNYVFQLSGGTEVYIITTPASDETVKEIRAWVDEKYNEGKPLKFTLRRAEPIEEPIELPKLPQFKGTTIYEVQGNIVPSGMEVCYYE